MDKRFLIKSAFALSLCLPLPGVFQSWLLPRAAAQLQTIVVGNQYARLGAPGASLPLQALPQPGGLGNYAGQTAVRSASARTDGSGTLELFEVNGNVYNGQGFRIADADGEDCVQCIPAGYSELLLLPVPGSCDLYYVVSSNAQGNGTAIDLVAGVLDMSRPHASQSCGRGRMVYENDFPNGGGGPYDQFEDWFFAGIENSGYTTTFATVGTGSENARTIGFAVMDPGWSNGHLLLHVTTDRYVHQYEVTATGIEANWTQEIESDYVTPGDKELTRDNDFGRDALTGDLLFATTDWGLWVDGDADSYRALVLRMNASTGALTDVTGYITSTAFPLGSGTDGTSGPYGCAFSPDGQKLYFTGDLVGLDLGVVDLATGIVTDLDDLTNLDITSPGTWERTRLTRGKAVGGVVDAIYYGSPDGLAAVIEPNDPATATWDNDVAFSSTLSGIASYSHPFDVSAPTCILMDALTTGDHHSEDLTLAPGTTCCSFMSDAYSECQYTFTGNNLTTPWTTSNNGFLDPDNDGVILFNQDYVVNAGASFAVTGMTLRFASTAHLIIKPGAYAKFTNCTLTCSVCGNYRWPGVRVEGNVNNASQSNAAQGRLELFNTEVSNARVGVWCAKEVTQGVPDVNSYGGIVTTWNQTRFRNCITGVMVENYHRHDGNGAELNNRSALWTTQFITDAARPDNNGPLQHVVLNNVNGIYITGCSFRNDDYLNMAFGTRGTGIAASDARFICQGTSLPNHYFRWLNVGVAMNNIDPLDASTINGMAFDQNVYGAVDLFGHGSMITNNRFRVLQNSTQTSQPSVGLMLWGAELYTVERNAFENPVGLGNVPCIGVWFLGPTSQDNKIYDNTFDDLTLASAVQGRHVAVENGQGNVLPGLRLLCNDYEDDVADWFIYPNGYIKSTQRDDQNAANNRFNGTSTCSGNFEILAFPRPQQYDNLYVDYSFFHWVDGSDPELRPECVEDEFGNSIVASTGQYFDLSVNLWPDEFDKEENCAEGDLEMPLLGNDDLHELHLEKLAEYQSAVANYYGTVDLDDKTALLDAIDMVPAWPSYQLRDLLLGHSPLSDTVLIAAILRSPSMDPWHLTQVLIANSRLSMPVQKEVDYNSGLSTYFLNMLAQYAHGSNLRHVLEQEIRLRSEELAGLERRLIQGWANDTVTPGRLDSLLAVFDEDADGSGLRMKYKTYVGQKHFAAAELYEADVMNQRDGEQLASLGSLLGDIGTDFSQATATQIAELEDLAFAPQGEASAGAWGALRAMGALDSLPVPTFPAMPRSSWVPSRRNTNSEPVLSAYPDPAQDRVNITYPEGLEDGRLEVYDSQGSLTSTVSLKGTPAFKELDVRSLRPGLYLARLVLDGHQFGETKFTVVR